MPAPFIHCHLVFVLPSLAISFDSTLNACISGMKSWTRNNNIYLKRGNNNSKFSLYHFTQNGGLFSQCKVTNIQAIALSLYAAFLLAFALATRSVIVENQTMIEKNFPIRGNAIFIIF